MTTDGPATGSTAPHPARRNNVLGPMPRHLTQPRLPETRLTAHPHGPAPQGLRFERCGALAVPQPVMSRRSRDRVDVSDRFRLSRCNRGDPDEVDRCCAAVRA